MDLRQPTQFISAWAPDLYHNSPDSGDLPYKLRGFKKAICPHSESWGDLAVAFFGDRPRNLCIFSLLLSSLELSDTKVTEP